MAESKPTLSIVILSYNVRDMLLNCLESVYKSRKGETWQLIMVDNHSSDGSVAAVKARYPEVFVLETGKNLGFAAGNNFAISSVKSDYVLFLNPDTLVLENAIQSCLDFLKSHTDFGAATCKVVLPDDRLDYSCHRGLPTPWNSLCYFLGLAKVFPKSQLFSGYTATYLDIATAHEIECATGAFLLVRKTAGEQIGWWDEDYFWNGDDVEFCYKLKEKNWKIMYLPQEKTVHFKGSSSVSSPQARQLAARSSTDAMRIFLRKHYAQSLLTPFVLLAIGVLEKYRLWFKYR